MKSIMLAMFAVTVMFSQFSFARGPYQPLEPGQRWCDDYTSEQRDDQIPCASDYARHYPPALACYVADKVDMRYRGLARYKSANQVAEIALNNCRGKSRFPQTCRVIGCSTIKR